MSYPFEQIEKKWREQWATSGLYAVTRQEGKPKYYVMSMLPYPSGAGLHMGHPIGYTAADIVARYRRMDGYNVLHPMGWDAFGLPAEQYAVKNKKHPRETTIVNIANFRRQLDMLGYSYDWTREIDTTDPGYFKWTQWIFLKIYNSYFDREANAARPIEHLIEHFSKHGSQRIPAAHPKDFRSFSSEDWNNGSEKFRSDILSGFRLAYLADAPVNWCPELGTVLANEEVAEQEEKGFTVVRRNMRQWMLRITAYAERLLIDLDTLNWPHHTMEQQRNWIGKSTGAELDFKIQHHNEALRVYTTRPDTIYGATYMVLAPEHPLVDHIVTHDQKASVEAYKQKAAMKSELERTELSKEKTGVFTGAYAINPATKQPIPIWIADYVLIAYGTGAIMAVPGHDERDHEFATTFKLPIKQVVSRQLPLMREDVSEAPYCEEGYAINSPLIDGLPTEEAKEKITKHFVELGIGQHSVKYKLRDWLFSRQRYWGEPFPIVYVNDGDGEYPKALPESALPVKLPDVESYSPSGTGESPLSIIDDWVNTTDPETGKKAKRETNTMPQWAGSSWYYLRYADPKNDTAFISKENDRYWQPVDLYIGGNEHAVTHLLYARFWHKMLFDLGYLHDNEPFKRLFHQGILLGENGAKMSKSLGNVVNPDDVVQEYGADTLRMYLMFLGPLEQGGPWNTKGIAGVHRFLNRLWRFVADDDGNPIEGRVSDIALSDVQERVMHQTIKKVREDIDALRLNTAISAMMIFMNEFPGDAPAPRSAVEAIVRLAAPFAPHVTEEIWHRLGHSESVFDATFPEYDEVKTVESSITLILQVNGKVRDKLDVPRGLTREDLEKFATASDKVQKHVGTASIKKVIVVPDKLVNVVVG